MPLCRRLRVSSSARLLVPVCSAAAGAGGLLRSGLGGSRGPGHAASSFSLVMSSMRLSWVAPRCPRHLTGDPAGGQGVDAVADAEQLGQLGGDDDDRLAGGHQPVDDRVDLVLGADVDAAGGLVEDQHVGVGEEPLATARPSAGCRRRACPPTDMTVGALMFMSCRTRSATLISSLPLTQPRRDELAEGGGGDVAPDVVDEVEAVALAVLGGVGDAVVDGLGHGPRPDLLAVHEDRARRCRGRSVRPKTLIASSVRPAPMRPAMPTTSPARTVQRRRRRRPAVAGSGGRPSSPRSGGPPRPVCGVAVGVEGARGRGRPCRG